MKLFILNKPFQKAFSDKMVKRFVIARMIEAKHIHQLWSNRQKELLSKGEKQREKVGDYIHQEYWINVYEKTLKVLGVRQILFLHTGSLNRSKRNILVTTDTDIFYLTFNKK